MTGVGVLLRAYLRRDRWMLAWWTVGGAILYWSQAISVEGLYRTQAEFDRAAQAMESNAALIAIAATSANAQPASACQRRRLLQSVSRSVITPTRGWGRARRAVAA